eukprot:gnl/MRDRNA2_/MRDRNA2_247451_c0_seq1.p1 gnl/MRDRNA2_/MRDRNA2_247451_c0~~gnl/MRDRNA2_/MRDRNA2_247451_c0_seq1.p1  ORF type:complete len:106 (-),score=15.52 gnl/MRDRNA2_/MRDRNA2_247451_c0_seq1:666-983(-)
MPVVHLPYELNRSFTLIQEIRTARELSDSAIPGRLAAHRLQQQRARGASSISVAWDAAACVRWRTEAEALRAFSFYTARSARLRRLDAASDLRNALSSISRTREG